MHRPRTSISLALAAAAILAAGAPANAADAFTTGKPAIESMSALAFGPDSVLFIGDGKGGAIYAVELGDKTPRGESKPVVVLDMEGKIAAFLGTTPAEIMIHDMAVNPISQNVYLAVSRGRGKWDSAWLLPNDIADAKVLVRVTPAGSFEAVSLDKVRYARKEIPNPVDPGKKHMWKEGITLRADTITDIAYADGSLFVAGLSNEEFASTMWKMPYPFEGGATTTTLEIFHGAHGKYETHAPIRTFVPYKLNGESEILAAYLCTPLVVFKEADLADGKHVKGRTVGEFGSGNYPLDMVVYKKDGQDRLLIANSNLPFMIVDPAKIAAYPGSITSEVKNYVEGVEHEYRSGTGVQQMDRLNDEFIVALVRKPGGLMNLESLPTARF